MASRIVSVKLVSPIQFFGVSGTQMAASQGAGLEFSETTKGILVTCKHFPGKKVQVFNANISQVNYEEVDA